MLLIKSCLLAHFFLVKENWSLIVSIIDSIYKMSSSPTASFKCLTLQKSLEAAKFISLLCSRKEPVTSQARAEV